MRNTRRAVTLTWLSVGLLVAALLLPAAVAAQVTTWTGGPGAILDPTYDGFIDAPTNGATVSAGGFAVNGWFVDKTAQGWAGADDVQIWQGTMDGGGKLLAKALFAQNRPDVAKALNNPYWANSGFSANVGSGLLGAGQQTISVYVHTGGKGWWYKQVNVNVSTSAPAAPSTAAPSTAAPAPSASSSSGLPLVGFVRPKDGETVLTKNDYEIQGWAIDQAAKPNQGVAGSGIDKVSVYLGAREDNGTYLGDATLGYSDDTAAKYGQQFASGGWRLTFKPTQFKANTYLLYAYAHSAVTGKEESANRFFAIREN
jgi:hypothetical protein